MVHKKIEKQLLILKDVLITELKRINVEKNNLVQEQQFELAADLRFVEKALMEFIERISKIDEEFEEY